MTDNVKSGEGMKSRAKAPPIVFRRPRLRFLDREEASGSAGSAGNPKSKPGVLVLRKPRIRLRAKVDTENFVPGDRYKVEAVIGSGGSGTVYKAHDILLKMPVAIKVLAPHLAADKEAIAMLKDEARIVMQLSHRHIVRLYNLEMAGSKYFLVMEYVEGETLRQAMKPYGKLPLASVAQIVEVCADALSYAHRHGVVHKDLKPDNLLLAEDGVLKIIDFGIAGLTNAKRLDGSIVGTLAYMSPEQIAGQALSSQTDVFSLGVIVYELLTGALPFNRDVVNGSISETVAVDNLINLPRGVRDAVALAMARNPDERWKSVSDFAQAFVKAAEAAREIDSVLPPPHPEA